jgi:hypothetical protein
MGSVTLAASSAPVITQVIFLAASVPLARFVRWQVAGAPTWDTTLRIMVAANVQGM